MELREGELIFIVSKFRESVKEAKELCPQLWMREALDELVRRQLGCYQQQNQHKEEVKDSTNL